MTKTRRYSFSKKALSVMLTLVMAFSYVGLLSGVFGLDLFGTKQEANAITSEAAGSYEWRVIIKSDNDTGGWKGDAFNVYGCKQNGTASQTTSAIASNSNWYVNFKDNNGYRYNTFGCASGDSKSPDCPGITTQEFPTKFTYYYKIESAWADRHLQYTVWLQVKDAAGTWQDVPVNVSAACGDGSSASINGQYIDVTISSSFTLKSREGTITYTVKSNMPTPSSTFSSGCPAFASTDGSVQATYSVAGAKDQFGVNWGFTSVEWESNKTAATITNGGVATFGANGGTDYDVTFKPTLINSVSDRKTTNGFTTHVYTTRSISYSYDGGVAPSAPNPTSYYLDTPPTTLNYPTKPGYTFAGWTGSNGSTPQLDVVIPLNTVSSGLDSFTTSNPYTASGRDHFFGNTFTVTPGNVYKVFVTAKRTAGSLNMQGGIWYTSYTSGQPYDSYSGEFTYLRDAGNGWGVYYKYIVVPAGKQAGQFYIQLEQYSPYGTTWQLADCRVTTAPISNLSFTAHWTPNDYTATFKADETPDLTGTVHDSPHDSTATFNTDGSITFPTGDNFARPYYTFDGKWKMYSIGSGESNWTMTDTLYNAGNTYTFGKYGDVTFRAQYTPVDYQIEFDPNGSGAGAIPSNWSTPYDNLYKYNYENREKSTYTLKTSLPSTTWLGYTLVGWQPTANVGNWDSTQVYPAGYSLAGMHGSEAGDTVVLKAVWTAVSSTVTLNLGAGESINGSTSLTYSFSSSLTLPNPTKTGYDFKGWKVTQIPSYGESAQAYQEFPSANRWVMNQEYELGQESNVTLSGGKLGDVTLTPMWEHIKYTITYNGNNGTTPSAKDYYIDSAAFALPGSTRNGYDFDGWTVTGHAAVYNWTEPSYAEGDSITGKYGNVTLTAQWKPHVYTITLDVAGGDALTPNTRTYKITESTSLPIPTKTGYRFTGWKVTSPGANTSWGQYTEPFAGDNPTVPSGNYGDLTLTAQWEHKTYTIDKSTNGTNGEDVTYHIDDAAFTLGGSVNAGFAFTGWQVTAADTDSNWTVGSVIGANDEISGKYGNVSVVAQFEAVTSYITYQNPDGSQWQQDSYTINDAVALRTYAKDGYTFDGWTVVSADADCWPSVGSLIPLGASYDTLTHYGNVTLKAALEPIGYTVTFDANGGLPLANLPYNIESAGETDVLPTPTRNGYDFDGWKVTAAAGNWVADATFAAGDAVTGKWGSPTLTAQWTPKKFTITYYTGAYPDGITKQGTFNETAPDLTDAEKAKPADAQYTYTFDHWDPALATVTGEATYTAVYTRTVNKYTVTWMIPTDVNGEPANYAGEVSDPIEYGTAPVYNNGVNPTLESANSAEYTWRFAGWSLTAGGEKLENLPVVTGNATYYALFTKVLRPEIVNWVINGVTNSEEWGIGETPEWKHDTPTKPDEDGYRFIFTGWDPTPVAVVQHGGPYTYTAQFSSEKQDYTVTLNLNGGTTEAALEYPYQMGEAVTFPAPEKTGYNFAGWKLDEAVGSWPADTVVPAGAYATGEYWGNVSFTAQWTPVNYTITFNAASEFDVLPEAMTYTIESTDQIPAATREGHNLSGWIVSVGSGNWTQGSTLAAAYQLLNNYGNVTLTPMWQVNTYTITWNSDGYIQTSQAEYGSAILAFTPISKMGYTADWDQEVPATMPAHDLEFEAVYTPVQYYIRLNVNGGNPVDNFYYTINGDNTLPTPTRDGATFLGWKVASAQGNWTRNALMAGGASLNGKYGNVSLTAQWDLERHTVTWVAGDVTKETVWLYGAVPSYDGTPYKSPDETNSYVFVGWAEDPEGDTLESLPAVTADVTYYAQFSKTERKYAVVWNIDGATTTEYYSYGQTPVYPGESDPVRPSTTEYDFTFTGWSPAVGEVTADVTYYAQFDVFTKLQGLSIDVASMFLNIGDDGAVQAQLYPATATVRDVIWTSLNPAVATVDNNGTITAVDAGIALINVSSVDKKFNAYCVVTVAPRHTKYVEITAGGISTTQLAGAMLQLSATIQPDNATDTGIRWSSGDVSVATVDGNGLVKYVGVGETDITAIASDGFSKGSIHVVTTTDETEVENEVKTYLVTFGEFYPGFKFTENGEHYTAGRLYVAEGETIRFKLDVQNSRQSGYSVYANTELMSCDGEYWYTLDNIQNNMIIRFADSAAGIGTPEEEDGGDSGAKLTFFERLAAFFRKIVEFFRGLFKK